jgi:prepilin-type N-terminal cleavage/methylation domain-containing protein
MNGPLLLPLSVAPKSLHSFRRGGIAGRGGAAPGFTLLEVLLALALLGSLLVALNVFVFSMAEAWGRGRDERLFAQHARAVTTHVEGLLHAAVIGAKDDAPAVREVRQENGGETPKLVFTLPEGSRLLTWPEAPLPDVELSLSVDERGGLILGWQSRLELRRDQETPRATVLSPFVTSLGWEYYDASFKRWELLDEPKREPDGTYLMPQRLHLRFAHGKLNLERVLNLPVRGEGATRS